ncbi:MAG: 30S ribosomal protein S19e [Fervidicoccaceae archaeon]|jgi:small subunit ribosomal protein S19e|uniref:Small ribosomal subunit protein eS19 n=1 Tax=Fervidicoccus fontis TaxID=683846 RepID=A0A7C2UKU2_9CREN|nr:MAG: 30S ribosomal protein S19e [Fervidicoccus sp.]HEU97510.1 30S ribosomal protein S19e [Fervidicoccus fontis]
MVTALQVPADELIRRIAKKLKEEYSDKVRPPEWSRFVKTGIHKEYPPVQDDWWYLRAASMLRKLYKSKEPIGITTFSVIYGGKKRFGSSPPHFRKASRAIIRNILKQLESAGLVTKVPGSGRQLTPMAVSMLDRVSKEIFKELVEKNPDLKIYLE